MSPTEAVLRCVAHSPAPLVEAALWIAVDHQPNLEVGRYVMQAQHLQAQLTASLPALTSRELAQPLLRQLLHLGFAAQSEPPVGSAQAMMHTLLEQRLGLPTQFAILALDMATHLGIALQAVDFPGQLLFRQPDADHLLDPLTGRRLYPADCRERLQQQLGKNTALQAEYFYPLTSSALLQRLSRELRQLHCNLDEPDSALKDADRVIALGEANCRDHLERAALYRRLECPQAERYDLQLALLLTDAPAEQLRITQRLEALCRLPAVH